MLVATVPASDCTNRSRSGRRYGGPGSSGAAGVVYSLTPTPPISSTRTATCTRSSGGAADR